MTRARPQDRSRPLVITAIVSSGLLLLSQEASWRAALPEAVSNLLA